MALYQQNGTANLAFELHLSSQSYSTITIVCPTIKLFSHQVDFPKGLQVLGMLFLKKVYQDNVYLMIRKYFHTEILNFKQSDILL